ncbi:hypothetical protein LWI29_036380 [Acer saccharum]|uniref:Retrotransposon gag domain-containing protein n=1 Tax=Acer saccharum TaxID=4024 RepID=A0AA39RU54_ACESA|nr:hypothetical protein LWI29_036380 [Acer saccharum]
MAKMAKELKELKKGKHRGTRKNPLREMNAPFSRRIREAELPLKFKMPTEKYSGSEDPMSHMESFVHQVEIQNATRLAMCRMFPSTMTDCAKTWFRKLPPGSVDSFTKLTTDFCAQFQGIKPRPKDPVLLQYVIQERGETLRSYVKKFHKEVDVDEQLRVKVEHDEARIAKRPKKESPKSVPMKKFQNNPPNRSTYRLPFPQHQERYPARRTPPQASPPLREVARVSSEEDRYNHYTPLNASRETIYLAIRDKGLLRKPGPIKIPVDQRNRYKYCDFHEDVGHNTSECYNLRNQIEGLVRGGLLVEFLQQVWNSIRIGKEVEGEMRDVEERRKDKRKDLMQQIQVIHTISGDPTLAGTSNNSRKNHARKTPSLTTGQDVFRVSRGSRDYLPSAQIIFTEDDAYNTVQPYDHPMVITV